MRNKEEERYQKLIELLSHTDKEGKIDGRPVSYVFQNETGYSYKTGEFFLRVMENCEKEVMDCVRAEKISITKAMNFLPLSRKKQKKVALKILASDGPADYILRKHGVIDDVKESKRRLRNAFSSISKADFDESILLSELQVLEGNGKLDQKKIKLVYQTLGKYLKIK